MKTTGAWPVYIAIAISGACALGAEVVWTRLLGLLLGATVYTFSIILAVFLGGLGIGGAARRCCCAAWVAARMGAAGIGLVPDSAGRGYRVDRVHAGRLASILAHQPPALDQPVVYFQIDLARAVWAILPATLLWGASFPLALGAAVPPGADPGTAGGRRSMPPTPPGPLPARWRSAWCWCRGSERRAPRAC